MTALDVATWVAGRGRPLVFVHGNASTHETWSAVTAHLADGFRCITWDLRGHGATPIPGRRFELEDMVDDLDHLRHARGLETMDLVGHSFGGMIVARYADRFPERVRSLSLLATPAFRSPEAQERGRAFVEAVRAKGPRAALGDMAAVWYRPEFLRDRPDAIEKRLALIAGIDEDVLLACMDLYAATEIGPWLEGLTCPVLILTGEFAVGCDAAAARAIHARLPGSRLEIVPDLRNGVLTEVPEVVAALLRDFVSSVPAPG